MDNQGTNSPPPPSPEVIEFLLDGFKDRAERYITIISELAYKPRFPDNDKTEMFKNIDINKLNNLFNIYEKVLEGINRGMDEDSLKDMYKSDLITEFKKIDTNQQLIIQNGYKSILDELESAELHYKHLDYIVKNAQLPETIQGNQALNGYNYSGYKLDKLPEGYEEESNQILQMLDTQIKKLKNTKMVKLGRFIEVDKIAIKKGLFGFFKSTKPQPTTGGKRRSRRLSKSSKRVKRVKRGRKTRKAGRR
jgi:hypothetical protein